MRCRAWPHFFRESGSGAKRGSDCSGPDNVARDRSRYRTVGVNPRFRSAPRREPVLAVLHAKSHSRRNSKCLLASVYAQFLKKEP